MTIQKMQKGYEQEVAYQKHMLKNMSYWFQLGSIISGMGIVLTYFFYHQNLWLTIAGGFMFVVGAFGMLLFGYAGWRGQQNINAVIDDFDKKIKYLENNHR